MTTNNRINFVTVANGRDESERQIHLMPERFYAQCSIESNERDTWAFVYFVDCRSEAIIDGHGIPLETGSDIVGVPEEVCRKAEEACAEKIADDIASFLARSADAYFDLRLFLKRWGEEIDRQLNTYRKKDEQD